MLTINYMYRPMHSGLPSISSLLIALLRDVSAFRSVN